MTLENVVATVENCRYCLMCRHVAPVAVHTHQESLTPHGIALTVASQRRGLLAWNEATTAVIFAEPDGGNCRAHCVTDQPLPEAIAAVKAELVAAGLAPPIVYRLRDLYAAGRSPFGDNPAPAAAARGDDALFVGDEAVHLWPTAVPAAIRLLAAAGIAPVQVGDGCSNGFLASSLGLPDRARQQAEAIKTAVAKAGATRLLLLSAGDAFTLGQLYDERLGVTWPDTMVMVEVVTLLADALADGRLQLRAAAAESIAYVDPTHAVRMPGRFDAVRALVTAVHGAPPRELFWRRERAHPVGSTALQFTRPEIAETLTRARLADARQTGAQIVLCEDPATLHHLARYAAEYQLQVSGLYEWLADHLAADEQ